MLQVVHQTTNASRIQTERMLRTCSTECRKFKNFHEHVIRNAGLSESLFKLNKIFLSSCIFETETHA